jgi:phosphopantothenoylcysteine decarboxylase
MMETKGQSRDRVLLCFSGSVASVKIPELYIALSTIASVKMVASSEAALFFLRAAKQYNPAAWKEFVAVGGEADIIPDSLEWTSWAAVGDPVVHIELR